MASFDLEQYGKDFLIVPLGGAGEIGMNVTLVYSGGKWLVIDLGVGFSDQELPGTDLTVPDLGFLIKHRKDIIGLVLTHAHEDHFGAVQYLWKTLGEPRIYGSPFTIAFLQSKLAAARFPHEIVVHEFTGSTCKFNIEHFSLTLVRMTHSIPDAYSLLIESQGVKYFHSGDWKLDDNPVICEPTDINALKTIGDSGVDVMLCDSTNVFVPNKSGNEGDLEEHFKKIISHTEGAVFVTMFASNIARIHTVASVAASLGRKVVVLGGALDRAIAAARMAGYLSGIENIYPIEEMSLFKRSELVIMCTGCQGEQLAAMSKIMAGKYTDVEVGRGDCVIFSSVTIPGNELKVCRIMNAIVDSGAELYSMRNAHVHVSGHPGQPELRRLYEYIRPKVAIPVHGEAMHLRMHAELARECGVSKAIVVKDGDVIRVSKGDVDLVGKVRVGRYAIDGKFFRAPDSEVMRVRRNRMGHGIVIANILLCVETGSLLKKPSVMAPGLLDTQHDKDILVSIVSQIERELYSKTNLQVHPVRVVVFSIIKRVCHKKMNKFPEIRVIVEKM